MFPLHELAFVCEPAADRGLPLGAQCSLIGNATYVCATVLDALVVDGDSASESSGSIATRWVLSFLFGIVVVLGCIVWAGRIAMCCDRYKQRQAVANTQPQDPSVTVQPLAPSASDLEDIELH